MKSLADLAQDIDVKALVRMQRDKHQPLLGAQAPEEAQHEADVAVLGTELRFVEEMDQRIVGAGALQHEVGSGAAEAADLIGLVVVDCEPVAFVVADAVNVLAGAIDAAGRRPVATGDQFEQRGLAGAIGPQYADDCRLVDRELRLKRERRFGSPASAAVGFSRARARREGDMAICHAPSSRPAICRWRQARRPARDGQSGPGRWHRRGR